MATTDSSQTIFPAAALTTSYVASSVIQTGNSSRLNVYLDFTLGSLTSLEVLVEFAPPSRAWHQATFMTITGGTAAMSPGVYQFTAATWGTGATTAVLSIDAADSLVRISAKGTGTTTGSSFAAAVQEANAS